MEYLIDDDEPEVVAGGPVAGAGEVAPQMVAVASLKLGAIASRYEGLAKFKRLEHIALHCSNYQTQAFESLLRALKHSSNTSMYEEIARRMGSSYEFDKNWFETTEKRMQQRSERAEIELNQAKSRVVKESIRMGHMEVGNLLMERGLVQEALKSYFRSRDFFSTPQHNTDMCMAVAIASVNAGLLRQAVTYANKIETGLEDPVMRSKIRIIVGLNALLENQFRVAAKNFLEVDVSANFSSVLAAEEVAIYGCMCALATLPRGDLRRQLLESKSFKPLLDLVPEFKSLASSFCNSEYGACLSQLQQLKPLLLVDIHMNKSAETLCTTISDLILIQYFTPYNSIDLRRMAEAFSTDIATLENSLAQLISKGKLPARIDSQAKTMHRRQEDDRTITLAKVKKLAKMHTAEIQRGVLRLSLLQNNNFMVTAREGKSSMAGGGGGGGLSMAGGSAGAGAGGMDVDPEYADDGEGGGDDVEDEMDER